MSDKSCCRPPKENEKLGRIKGILYGLLPHTFCIAFVVASIIGATAATAFLKKFLLLPYFFEILVGLSLVFATLSAVFYLKRNSLFSVGGVWSKWRYLSILYGTTLLVNLLFFSVIFPRVANLSYGRNTVLSQTGNISQVTIQVQIPCSGHAPLIIDELKKLPGIGEIKFQTPNQFRVSYDSSKTDPGKIVSAEIFRSYPAIVVGE